MLLLVLIGIKPEHNVSKAEILAFQGKLESNYHFILYFGLYWLKGHFLTFSLQELTRPHRTKFDQKSSVFKVSHSRGQGV